MQKITPFLWFDNNLEEALALYTSVFKNSSTSNISRYGEGAPVPAGAIISATFELEGQRFMAMNGGPAHRFNEAVSFFVNCETQEEIDELWEKLSEGGETQQCGWLKDRFGLSWQIVPSILGEVLGDPDPEKSQRALQAMLGMKKLDIEGLKAAHEGR